MKAEFESFRASVKSIADNLSERVETLINEVRRSNANNQTRQIYCNEVSYSAEMGVDGPAPRDEMIEMEGMQQDNRGTNTVYN